MTDNELWKRLAQWGWNGAWADKALAAGAVVDRTSSGATQVTKDAGGVSSGVSASPNVAAHGGGAAETPHDREALIPGRVVRHVHHTYDLMTPISSEPISMEVSGAYAYRTVGPADFPTVGDWVLFRRGGRIESLLSRESAISRGAAGGETLEQVIAANVDVVFLVFGLDGGRNFTVGMLERSVLAAWNSGGRPVIVLNKSDCADAEQIETVRHQAEAHAPGVSIHVVSAHRGDGLTDLRREIAPGETVGLLGKSGVGKSALVNGLVRLAEPASTEVARTGEQRKGDRQGRHTTTDKSLYLLPGGILLADVPGLRELQLWGDSDDLSAAFPEIEALATECRFTDCAHSGEPGCRVQEAIATGELPIERYERYLEYQKELAYLARRKDQRANVEEQKKWKRIAMMQRQYKKG
jgi:ribosome biogenesis GTPase